MLAVLFFSHIALKRRLSRKMFNTDMDSGDSECCRTCLGIDKLSPLFPSKETELKRADELHTVTGLQIKANDGLSQQICDNCQGIINSALKFRKTSRKAEKVLLNNVSGRKKKKKNNIKCTKVKEKKLDEDDKIEIEIEETWHEYDEGFQNDDETAVDHQEQEQDEEQENEKTEQEKNAKPGRRKRLVIPNAPSYKCNTCSKEFRMKATYKAHLRFHTNYCVCETCGKRCRNNNQLQEHKRARHGLGRIHKCAYCEYSSATKEALTIHERRHTGERPYICDHCGASFHRRSNLVQHIAIHNPDKNFQCDMCPKRLKSRKFLQIHKHNAHTGKRYGYLCPVCDHRFEKPNKVRAHSRRVHLLPDHQQGPIVRVQL